MACFEPKNRRSLVIHERAVVEQLIAGYKDNVLAGVPRTVKYDPFFRSVSAC